MSGRLYRWIGVLLALCAFIAAAEAKTFRWANDGDANSMDPYARLETFLLLFDMSMYEPLIRIPMVISWPGRLTPGTRDDLVTQIDLAPTLASLAGLKWPSKITGVDLTREKNTRDAVFLEYYSKQKWVNPIRTIRMRKWKLNWYDSGHQELYDLETDPHELRNLAADTKFSSEKSQLESRLTGWRAPLTKS